MYFKGKYLIGHILVTLMVITCLVLSGWQFARLDERKELNKKIESRMQLDPVKLDSVLLPGDKHEVVLDSQYRRVSVIGKYSEKGEVFILGRSRNSEPGYLVMTPLLINPKVSSGKAIDGDVVYVNRGWVPQSLGDGILDGNIERNVIEPSEGYEVTRTVSGLVRANERKTLFSETSQISADVTNRIDTNLFLDISGSDTEHMYPLWIHMLSETLDGKVTAIKDQAVDEYPKILEPPELTEKNHLSYAVQWAMFAFTALITWIIICVKAKKKDLKKTNSAKLKEQNQ